MSAEDRDTPTEHRASLIAFRLITERGGITASEFAKVAGTNRKIAYLKLRDLRAVGLVGIKGRRRSGTVMAPVFGFGDDEIDGPPKGVPGARVIAFKTLINGLRESSSVTDLVDETGINRNTIHAFLRSAHAWRVAYISAWTPPIGSGSWVPRWKLGRENHRPQPAAQSRETINARYWAKRAERVNAKRIHEALTLPLAA